VIHYRRKRKFPPTTTTKEKGEGKGEEHETVAPEEREEEEDQKHLLADLSPVESKRSSASVEVEGKHPVYGNTNRVQNLIY